MPPIETPESPAVPPLIGSAPLPWYRQRNAVLSFRVVLAASVAGLLYWFVWVRPYVTTDDARVDATLARVAPEGAGGRVVKVDVSEGDTVKAGQVLVELDSAKAQAEYERAAADALLASRDLVRAEKLAAEHGLSDRQLDMARAKASESGAERSLAQLALDQCVLRSPFDGVVIQKATDTGNQVETGQTAVTVADLDYAWVLANMEETDTGGLEPGQAAAITVDEGGTLDGHVLEVDRATLSTFAMIPAENSSGNFIKLVQRIPVKIALDPHPGSVLRVGESVEVRIKVR